MLWNIRTRTAAISLRYHPTLLFGVIFGYVLCFVFFDPTFYEEDDRHKTDERSLHNRPIKPKLHFSHGLDHSNSDKERERNNPRILCLVATSSGIHELNARHVNDTWGRRCDSTVFVDYPYVSLKLKSKEGKVQCWENILKGFHYILNKKFEFDWLLQVNGYSYVIMENVRRHLTSRNSLTPLFFVGKPRFHDEGLFNEREVAFILSKESVAIILDSWVNWIDCCNSVQEMRKHFERMNLEPMCGVKEMTATINEDEELRGSEDDYMEGFYEFEVSYCNEEAFFIHGRYPDMMYVLEYLIYVLKPYGLRN